MAYIELHQTLAKRNLVNPIYIIAIVAILASCVSQNKVTIIKSTTEYPNKTIDYNPVSQYKIQKGDHLYIKINSYEPKTSKFFQNEWPALMNPTYLYLNSYIVDDDGYVHFSFIEKVKLSGLTIEAAQKLLQKTISEYFNDANVYLRLVNFQISILGEVAKPGNYIIDKNQVNIIQAIALAGDFNTFAKTKKVKLIRKTETGVSVHTVDFTRDDLIASEYFNLMPDDILYVEPRAAKSFAFEKFPYSIFFSIAAAGVSIYTLTKVK